MTVSSNFAYCYKHITAEYIHDKLDTLTNEELMLFLYHVTYVNSNHLSTNVSYENLLRFEQIFDDIKEHHDNNTEIEWMRKLPFNIKDYAEKFLTVCPDGKYHFAGDPNVENILPLNGKELKDYIRTQKITKILSKNNNGIC